MPFLIALGAGLLLTAAARPLGAAVGLVDRPGHLKIHDRPVSLLGGVAVTLAAGVAVAVGEDIPVAVLGAVGLALAVGLADDTRPLPPWLRLVLLAAAGGLLSVEVRLELLGPASVPATVLVVAATANAVNILDGQDGLVGGVAATAGLGLAGVGALAGSPPAVSLGLAVAGALLGFLAWNRPPARVFLGNGGAYAVGTALAALAVLAVGGSGPRWPAFLGAGLCLGVPVFELLFTVTRRVTGRTRLAGGDREHSYDLVAARVGRARSTAIFWLLGGLAAGSGTLVALLPAGFGLALILVVAAASAVAARRLWAARTRTGSPT